MYVILPITNVADQLCDDTNRYLHPYALRGYTGLNHTEAILFCQDLAEYIISDALMWTNQPRYDVFIETLLCRYFSWWEQPYEHRLQLNSTQTTTHQSVCDQLYTQAIDPQECRLRHIIESIIGDDERWLVWYTTKIHHDLALWKGEDYRIVDFEQRVLSNATTVSERARAFIFNKNRRTLTSN
jgi:hypothetical protein